MSSIVYTVGHSNRSLDEFLRLLQKYGITLIIDIRRFPKSRKYPHFNKEYLENILSDSNLKYMWLGDLLGGYRKEGYREYMKTRQYQKGIEKLVKIIEKTLEKL